MTRSLTALGLTLVAVAGTSGCGKDASTGSAFDSAAGYLPADSPIVISIDTDADGKQAKALRKIIKKFPFAGQIERGIKQGIRSRDFNYEEDLKPLLGNEFVIGATDAKSVISDGDDKSFVGAVRVPDGDALEKMIDREKAKEVGEKGGAKLYEGSDKDAFAVEGDMLVVAGSRKLLEEALERKDGDDKLKGKDFDAATADLPKDALLRMSADFQQLIAADPDSQEARKVKWVSALRDFGLAVTAKEDSIGVEFRLSTEGDLAEADLPFAAGAASPDVIARDGEIGLGFRGLSQIVKFAESAGQSVNPTGFGDYDTAKLTLEKRLGIDIDRDLIDQVEEDISASVSVDGKFGMRAKLKDPATFERTLDKLGKVLPSFAQGATGEKLRYAAPKGKEGFYTLRDANGDAIVYRVVDGDLVLANDPKRAAELSSADAKAVPGAEGSLVLAADAEQLVKQAIAGTRGGLEGALGGALFAGPLAELTGSMAVTTEALTGNFELGFDG